MQDPTTGVLHPIDRKAFRKLEEARDRGERVNAAFKRGEVLEIRGGRFRVESIGKRELRLRSLPAVDVREAGEREELPPAEASS